MIMPNIYYPLKLTYYAKETLWGGSKLSMLFGKGSSESLGETWELTVRNNENCFIKNGSFAGITLKEYLLRYTKYSPDHFPLLIKFIDAKEDLSIQVHPDDTYAESIGEKNGKTEMWYVVEADEHSSIVYGTKPNVDAYKLKDAIKRGNADNVLNRIEVSKGDVFFIPGGLTHAIGKGVLVAEIQQNSDNTFRLYDYGRKDKSGKLRPLHIEQADNAFKSFSDNDIQALRFSKRIDPHGGEVLVSCDYFTVILHDITETEKKHFKFETEPFFSLLCVGGYGSIIWENGKESIQAGDSLYVPCELGSFSISGNLKLLLTTV